MHSFVRLLIAETRSNYPDLVHRIFFVNAPMFFEDIWGSFKESLSANTLSKVRMTGEHYHPELSEMVDESSLPVLYGGACKCSATCVYSDKGPWSNGIENKINFKEKGEEFKYEDDYDDAFKDDDDIEDDLLDRGDMDALKD